MKLIYIDHSGYALLGEGFTIIMDYYRDPREIHEELLKRPGKLYVLCSHEHPDHFNPKVLEWKAARADIHYIFSSDIKSNVPGIVFLKKGDTYRDDLLTVRAFGSTDMGISFLIDVEGKRILHAGDLNNWHWKEESTPEEVREAETAYLHELEDLARVAPRVDVALFPVDPRLGKEYMRGAEQFIDRIKTGLFAPMHFWGAYDKAAAFQSYAEEKGVRFMDLRKQVELRIDDSLLSV